MSIFSHHLRSFFKKPRTRVGATRGFTLIELLVVMAIMLIVTGVMLFKQSKFDSSTILRGLAYSVALSMRQAQVYGTSVLGNATSAGNCTTTSGGFYNTTTGTCFASAYGVFFNSSSPGQYTLFADLNSNGKYDSGEDVKVFTLGTGYTVSQFCATGANGGSAVTRCSPSVINSVSVVFKRPNPDAQFYADFNGTPVSGDIYSSVTIQIQSQGDTTAVRKATVTSTGLISAQ